MIVVGSSEPVETEGGVRESESGGETQKHTHTQREREREECTLEGRGECCWPWELRGVEHKH